MKAKFQSLALAALAFWGLFLAQSAFASSSPSPLDFTLVNDTGYDINAVYLSARGSGTWGKNLLHTILRNGPDFPLSYNADQGPIHWDIMVRYVGGAESEWKALISPQFRQSRSISMPTVTRWQIMNNCASEDQKAGRRSVRRHERAI